MDQPDSDRFPDANKVTEALLGLLTRIPSSQETPQSLPEARAREVAKAAAMRAAAISADDRAARSARHLAPAAGHGG